MKISILVLYIIGALCLGKTINSEAKNLPPISHSLNSVIAQSGLDMLCELVSPAIPQMLYESGIPDIKGSANGLDYSMTNFAFSYVDLPGIFASFVDGVGISGGCRGASVSLGFDYSFRNNGYPHFDISDSGGLISISDMTVAVVCEITSTDDNKEQLTVVGESLNITDMKIEIGNSNFINIILSIMTPIIKNILEDVMGQVVGGIIETLINPSIGKAVVVPLNSQIRLPNGLYQNIFIDKRLVGDPLFQDSLMSVRTDARWFVATYSDPYDVTDATINWDGHTVEYNETELPYQTSTHQFQTIVRTDAWTSLWDSYIRIGYFVNNVTNPTVTLRVPCKAMDKQASECFETVPVTTTFIASVLPNIDLYYPAPDYDVNFSYSLTDETSLAHTTYYTGNLVKFSGSACLRVRQKVNTSIPWEDVLCVSGDVELSEVPSLIPGTPNIQLDFYYHQVSMTEVRCPLCENALWGEDYVYMAVLAYINLGVIPFLQKWSVETALVTNIFDGLFLTDTAAVFDRDLGVVSISGDLES